MSSLTRFSDKLFEKLIDAYRGSLSLVLEGAILFLIKAYQVFFRPTFGNCCRYSIQAVPNTVSQAIVNFGFFRGTIIDGSAFASLPPLCQRWPGPFTTKGTGDMSENENSFLDSNTILAIVICFGIFLGWQVPICKTNIRRSLTKILWLRKKHPKSRNLRTVKQHSLKSEGDQSRNYSRRICY